MSSRKTVSARWILIQFFIGGCCINLSNHLKFFKDRRNNIGALKLWIRQIETVQAITERTYQNRCAVTIFFYLLFLQARENEWLFTCYSTTAAGVFCSSWAQALRSSYFICKISLWLNISTSLKCKHLNPQCTLLTYVTNVPYIYLSFASVLFQKILNLAHPYTSKAGACFQKNETTLLARHSFVLMEWKYSYSSTYS